MNERRSQVIAWTGQILELCHQKGIELAGSLEHWKTIGTRSKDATIEEEKVFFLMRFMWELNDMLQRGASVKGISAYFHEVGDYSIDGVLNLFCEGVLLWLEIYLEGESAADAENPPKTYWESVILQPSMLNH